MAHGLRSEHVSIVLGIRRERRDSTRWRISDAHSTFRPQRGAHVTVGHSTRSGCSIHVGIGHSGSLGMPDPRRQRPLGLARNARSTSATTTRARSERSIHVGNDHSGSLGTPDPRRQRPLWLARNVQSTFAPTPLARSEGVSRGAREMSLTCLVTRRGGYRIEW
jgi:hypothetical protein